MDGHTAVERSTRSAAAAAPRAALALAGVYIAFVAWCYRDYAMDDAYIGFRYVANLLAGNGLVFTSGAAVEGVSNIAWLILIAPLAALMGPIAAAKIAAAALVVLTLFLVFRAAQRAALPLAGTWAGYALLPGAVLILAAASGDFVAFSMLGMETALLAALLAGLVVLSFDAPRPAAWAALGAVAFLAHPEAALVLPLGLAIAVASRALDRAVALRCLAIFAALIAAATAARWAYYGDVVPNTFLSKPSSVIKFLAHLVVFAGGKGANIAEPFTNLLAVALAALGYTALRRVAPLAAAFAAAATLTGLLFALYALPDWTKQGRYFAPYAPAALLLLACGAFEIARRLQAGVRGAKLTAAALAVGIGLPGAIQTFQMTSDATRLAYPGYVIAGSTLVAPAQWLRDNLPADATIATRRVGVLGYYAPQAIFDYKYGLNDRAVAAAIRAQRRQFGEPNDPALAALWTARAPDYVLEDGNVIDRISSGNRAGFRVHGIEYRVVKTFPIGREAEWTLAARVTPRAGLP